MNKTNEFTATLQKHLLDQYKEIKKIFDENGIRYFGIGGTAIGALREGGFIEWDDDMDIAVLEEDIPKMLELIKQSRFKLNNPYYKFRRIPFFKIYDPNVWLATRGEITPVNIDIFIAARTRVMKKSNWKKFKFFEFVLYSKTRRLKNFDRSHNFGMFFGFWIMGRLFFWISGHHASKRMSNVILEQPIDTNTPEYIRHCYHVDLEEQYDIREFKTVNFEDTVIPVNTTFAEDMKWRYGDIMAKPTKKHIYNHSSYIYNGKKKITSW